MLDSAQIAQIARKVATEHLSAGVVDDVSSQEVIDSRGQDAVRITITLKPKAAQRLSGDAVLDTLVAIQTQFANSSDNRLPIVEYEEAGELTEADDAQP